MMSEMDRLMSLLAATQVFATLVANTQTKKPDAVVLFPGLNNGERASEAVRLACVHNRPLISTGTNDEERGRDGDVDEKFLRDIASRLGMPDGLTDVWAEAEGPHVPCQVWNLLCELGYMPGGRPAFKYGNREVSARPPIENPLRDIRSVAVVADGWHLLRVVLTYARIVRSGIETGIVSPRAAQVKLYPRACLCRLEGSLGAMSEAHLTTGYENVFQAGMSEAGRLLRYVEHVGTLNDLLWLLKETGQTGY